MFPSSALSYYPSGEAKVKCTPIFSIKNWPGIIANRGSRTYGNQLVAQSTELIVVYYKKKYTGTCLYNPSVVVGCTYILEYCKHLLLNELCLIQRHSYIISLLQHERSSYPKSYMLMIDSWPLLSPGAKVRSAMNPIRQEDAYSAFIRASSCHRHFIVWNQCKIKYIKHRLIKKAHFKVHLYTYRTSLGLLQWCTAPSLLLLRLRVGASKIWGTQSRIL